MGGKKQGEEDEAAAYAMLGERVECGGLRLREREESQPEKKLAKRNVERMHSRPHSLAMRIEAELAC